MEELHKIAESYYKIADEGQKAKGQNFFVKMAKGGKKVYLPDFTEFMKAKGHLQMANKYFFNDLKKKGRNSLGLMEVMTVYYIITSKRPFCGSCGLFIKGAFFTCLDCFHKPDAATYNLCVDCYHAGHYNKQKHNEFCDNFALLALSKPGGRTFNRHPKIMQEPQSTSTSIVPYKRPSEKKFPFNMLIPAIAVANFVASVCSIM